MPHRIVVTEIRNCKFIGETEKKYKKKRVRGGEAESERFNLVQNNIKYIF
ncbi:MAG: hypothetical protein ACI90V_006894 [Bacillariaceae sp.]|jgi:hypothetical protein